MLLDIYYKLLWWAAQCAANMQSTITIPLTYFADGQAHNILYWTTTGERYCMFVHGLLTKPYAGMLSQTATPKTTSIVSGCNVNNTNFVVGSGTTPVTGGDYRIEQEIVEGLACEAVTSQIDEQTRTVTFRKTLRNTSDGDITIREVGLTGGVGVANSSVYQVLIYREVLGEPVTIAPGDSATLRIAIRHELPV